MSRRQLSLAVRRAIDRRDDAARRRILVRSLRLDQLNRPRISLSPLHQYLGTAQHWSWTFVSAGTSLDVVVAQVRSASCLPDAWIIVAVARPPPADASCTTRGIPQGDSLSPVVVNSFPRGETFSPVVANEHADDVAFTSTDITVIRDHANNFHL